MKQFVVSLVAILVGHLVFAQNGSEKENKKNPCSSIVVDIEKGRINDKIEINSPLDTILKYLPCVTEVIASMEEDGRCAGGISLGKQGVIFNPEKGFIEFSETTTAKLPIKVFGISEDSLNESMSGVAQVSDISSVTSDRPTHSVYLYPKNYGCLAIWIDLSQKRVMRIQMHNKNFSTAFLCTE